MTYRPQVKGSRSGRGHQKTQREKAKAKSQKHRLNPKTGITEQSVPTPAEVVEKTLGSLRGLGNQKFALSPFSEYFDDWLINLRKVLSVFESSPLIGVDEKFTEERQRILADVEGELARKRLEETALEEKAKALSEKNHLLVQIDADYATQLRDVRQKRNNEIQKLTQAVQELENELDQITKTKTSFFGAFTKKAKAKKQAEATEKLTSAKKELEMAIQNFTIEQEKFHDEYEKKKQETIEQVQALEKEITTQETDTSQEQRRAACEALVEAINALLARKPPSN